MSSDYPNPSSLNFNNDFIYTDKKINCFRDGKLALVDLRVEWAKVKQSTQKKNGKRMCSSTEVGDLLKSSKRYSINILNGFIPTC